MAKGKRQKNKEKRMSLRRKNNSDSEVSTGTELAPPAEERERQDQPGTGASVARPDKHTKETVSLGGPSKLGSNHTLTGGPLTGVQSGRFPTIQQFDHVYFSGVI